VLLGKAIPPSVIVDGRCLLPVPDTYDRGSATDSTQIRVLCAGARTVVIVIMFSTPFKGLVVTGDGLVQSVEKLR
jgi:hypothetical protein